MCSAHPVFAHTYGKKYWADSANEKIFITFINCLRQDKFVGYQISRISYHGNISGYY
jgi:hypothetical protein